MLSVREPMWLRIPPVRFAAFQRPSHCHEMLIQ